ncbi:BgTH12-07815, partial [Blumeria graminis f. sp. triticale]
LSPTGILVQDEFKYTSITNTQIPLHLSVIEPLLKVSSDLPSSAQISVPLDDTLQMKLISIASTTALAGLLLLVPAAYGDRHQCSYGKAFSISEIQNKLEYGNFVDARPGDPTDPDGIKFYAMRFDMMPVLGVTITYLIQIVYEPPYYRFYEKTSSG